MQVSSALENLHCMAHRRGQCDQYQHRGRYEKREQDQIGLRFDNRGSMPFLSRLSVVQQELDDEETGEIGSHVYQDNAPGKRHETQLLSHGTIMIARIPVR